MMEREVDSRGPVILNESDKLKSLASLGIELNQIHDLDILMEHILSRARMFANAEAGSIYIREGDTLKFSYTQNDVLQRRIPEGEKLIYSTFTIPIDSTSIAGFAAETGTHLNIPDVYVLDESLPYRFNSDIDKAAGYRTRSLLTIPLETAGAGVVGILQVLNALNVRGDVVPFSSADEEFMFHFASVAAVALDRARMTRATLLRMIRMSELRDPKETGAHVNRVAGYSVELYERWAVRRRLPRDEIASQRDVIRIAAMLHDVGKVAIPDKILKKPGAFNSLEVEIMKRHTILGARLFRPRQSEYDDAAFTVSLCHHERWDGGGYPGYVDVETGSPLEGHVRADGSVRGKQGNDIPLFGRIVALADVYDALSSVRVYKDAWQESDVLHLIKKESGAQFDPELVSIFFSCLDVMRSIRERYKNDP